MRHLRHVAAIALAVGGALTAGCGPTTTSHPQLDRMIHSLIGSGAQTTAATHLPHAKYTFFTWDDPPGCVQGMELLDAAGTVRAGHAQLAAPELTLVEQRDIPAGDYRVRTFTGAPRCAWMVEEILNRMQSDDAPPPAAPAPRAQAFSAIVSRTSTPIRVPATGLYRVEMSVSAPPGQTCSYKLSLVTSTGDAEVVTPQHAVGGGGSETATSFLFLTAGERTVAGVPACPWEVSVMPLIGPNGGGVHGFAPPYA